jgi:hypothetical protein
MFCQRLPPHVIHQHALVLGDSAAGTVNNLLSNSTAFGLSRHLATEIVEQIQDDVKHQWQETLYEAGLGVEEIRHLEPFFKEIPSRQIEHSRGR